MPSHPQEHKGGKPSLHHSYSEASTCCLTEMTPEMNSLRSFGPMMEEREEYLHHIMTDTDVTSSVMDKNPIEKALESVGRKVQDWKEQQIRRKESLEAHLRQVAHEDYEFATSPEGILQGKKRLESFGELGVALIYPIEGAFCTQPSSFVSFSSTANTDDHYQVDDDVRDEEHEHRSPITNRSDSITPPLLTETHDPIEISDDEEEGHHDFEIEIIPDDPSIPRLLCPTTMKKLMMAMPFTLQGRAWKRIFSITRDGDSFPAFLNGIRGYDQTLIVVQTTKGDTIGGFADAAWDNGSRTIDGSFFGTGTSFLFSIQPTNRATPLQIFRWKGVNEYSQLCRLSDGCVGMGGGGGSFGLFLQEDFTRGSSGACDTYGNTSPLTSSECFDILNFEVYGFARHSFWS